MPVLSAGITDRCHHTWSTVSSNKAHLLLSSSLCQLCVTDFRLVLFCLRPFLPVPPLWWLLTSFGICTGGCLHVLPNNAFSTYQKWGTAVFASENASSKENTVGIPTYTEARRGQRTVPGALALVCTQLYFLWSRQTLTSS